LVDLPRPPRLRDRGHQRIERHGGGSGERPHQPDELVDRSQSRPVTIWTVCFYTEDKVHIDCDTASTTLEQERDARRRDSARADPRRTGDPPLLPPQDARVAERRPAPRRSVPGGGVGSHPLPRQGVTRAPGFRLVRSRPEVFLQVVGFVNGLRGLLKATTESSAKVYLVGRVTRLGGPRPPTRHLSPPVGSTLAGRPNLSLFLATRGPPSRRTAGWLSTTPTTLPPNLGGVHRLVRGGPDHAPPGQALAGELAEPSIERGRSDRDQPRQLVDGPGPTASRHR
jgi:hypothetical protein